MAHVLFETELFDLLSAELRHNIDMLNIFIIPLVFFNYFHMVPA